MATSEAEVCNLALSRVGVTQFIAALTEDSAEASACRAVYVTLRDATLAAAPWPFCRRRASLPLLEGVETGAFAYAYALPADCLAVERVEGDSEEARVPYRLEANAAGDGMVLLTDRPEAEASYRARVTAPVAWNAAFASALAWALAAELALSLAKRPDMQQSAMLSLFRALDEAEARAASQGQQAPTTDSPTVAARG